MPDPIRREDLEKLDLSAVATDELLANVTPGEVLRTEFMEPLGLSAGALARDIGVPANRITEILNAGRAVTAETAILLAGRFGTSAEFRMNLQTAFDLEAVRRRRESHGLPASDDAAIRAVSEGRLGKPRAVARRANAGSAGR